MAEIFLTVGRKKKETEKNKLYFSKGEVLSRFIKNVLLKNTPIFSQKLKQKLKKKIYLCKKNAFCNKGCGKYNVGKSTKIDSFVNVCNPTKQQGFT